MKKLILIIAFLTLYLPVQSQYIPGLIDTLWLEYPNDAVVYSVGVEFNSSGDIFVADGAGNFGKGEYLFPVDSINFGTISIIDSDTGMLIDTLFSDSLNSFAGAIRFFPNNDSLLISKSYTDPYETDSIQRICIYDLNTKEIVNVIRPEYPYYHNDPGIGTVLLSNTGDSLILQTGVRDVANHHLYYGYFQIWNLNTNDLLEYEQCDDVGLWRISPSGQNIVLGTSREGFKSKANLLYMDSLSNGFCDNWVSVYDSTTLESTEGGAIFSPSGRFLAVGTGEYIYDVLNQEPYLSWDFEDFRPANNYYFTQEIQFFIDDRFILFEISRLDTITDIQYYEWWVFDIETSQFVHKEDQRRIEQLRYYSTYDPVGNRMIYHGQDNRARMYKINVEKLYENVSVDEKIEQRNESGISIYPNPAGDYIEINPPQSPFGKGGSELASRGIFEIKIYNVLGEKVLNASTSASGGQIRLDVSHLPTGLYFIKIGDNVQKFVKE